MLTSEEQQEVNPTLEVRVVDQRTNHSPALPELSFALRK
jgi:hypothetical protein